MSCETFCNSANVNTWLDESQIIPIIRNQCTTGNCGNHCSHFPKDPTHSDHCETKVTGRCAANLGQIAR